MAEMPDLTGVREVVAREAAAGEEAGRLTPAAVDALRGAGLFALHQPADLGGLGLPLPVACRVIAEVAAADGAAGWAAMIGAGPAWFAGWMDPVGATEVFGGGAAVAGSGQAGRVEPAGDGAWRLWGRWRWCSGAPWAEWFTFNGRPDGGDDVITVAVPAGEVEVHPGTWDVRGLRATASGDVSVDGVVVPAHRCFRVGDGAPARSEAVFRVPFAPFAEATMASVPAGLATGAVPRAAAATLTREPTHGTGRVADDPHARTVLAGAAGAVRAAVAALDAATARVWEATVAGGEVPGDALVDLTLAAVHVAGVGSDLPARIGPLAGMGGLARSSALGRALDDLPAAARNTLLAPARLATVDPADLAG